MGEVSSRPRLLPVWSQNFKEKLCRLGVIETGITPGGVGQSSSRIGHATSERTEKFHELLEHSLPFGSQWPLCWYLHSLGFSPLCFTLAFLLPFGFHLFGFSFQLPFIFFFFSSTVPSHRHTRNVSSFRWVIQHTHTKKKRREITWERSFTCGSNQTRASSL